MRQPPDTEFLILYQKVAAGVGDLAGLKARRHENQAIDRPALSRY